MALVLLFVTTGPSIRYVPKSQRNLLSKAFRLLTQPLRDKAYEIVDRYNWAVAKNRDWFFSFPATLIYETVQAPKKEREVVFDTDSETIGVDNRCSACISHKAEDFVSELKRSAGPTNRVPHNAAGAEMCLSHHIKGMCNANCAHRADHRDHTPGEDDSLLQWCQCHCAPEWEAGGGFLRIYPVRSESLTPPVTRDPSSGPRSELHAQAPELRARKQQRTSKAQELQEQVVNNNLRECIACDTHLLRTVGWHETVRQRRGRGDFGDLRFHHPAQCFLSYLGCRGAPVVFTAPPWDRHRICAAMTRGPHKSAHECQDFPRDEMAEMILRRQWIVLPCDEIKHFPGLQLGPIGVVPQQDCRPRTIVDCSFHGVKDETCGLAPEEAMRFGQAFQRLVEDIVSANPRFGPVHLCKIDTSNGFCRVWLRLEDIPKLGVAFPTEVHGEPLVAFPLALPMGWVSSPPCFCSAAETVANVANERIMQGHRPH